MDNYLINQIQILLRKFKAKFLIKISLMILNKKKIKMEIFKV